MAGESAIVLRIRLAIRQITLIPFVLRKRYVFRSLPLVGIALLLLAMILWPASIVRAQDGTSGEGEWEPGEATSTALDSDEVAAEQAPGQVVINEILYRPARNTEWFEFVELYNPGATPVNLTGWTLRGGVDFDFPTGLQIAGNGYAVIAESPQALGGRFGVSALGPFAGHLKSAGEELKLRDYKADLVDEVEYGEGFPWPNTGKVEGSSIQLVNAALDNAAPGHWRSGEPTPGRANVGLLNNAPPRYLALFHEPQQPREGDPVKVIAQVRDADGIKSVRLGYQVVAPGSYITLDDPAYQTNWTWTPMSASGQDLIDGIYSVVLPGSLQRNRTLIRYRIVVEDNAGQLVTAPYADDPQPNFAYFVYNGLPTWYASIQGSAGATTFDFNGMRSIATYHFLAREKDVTDAMFMPPSKLGEGYMGDDYNWRGTLVHNGEVYDHVGFRAKGGLTRYATGKTSWKINFLPGRGFMAYDDFGKPYAVRWDKLTLNAIIQQTLGLRDRRGEQGMYESATFRLFNLAGVPAPNTHFVHWRVVDSADEYGSSQYDGDFWGLYLAIEQMDGRFLDEHGLPDGNLYKMDWEQAGGDDRNHLGRNGPDDYSDLNGFLNSYQFANPSAEWWRQNLDLEGYYSYRAILELVHHYDVDQGKNYYYFNNPELKRWQVLPWDVDLTWHLTMPGTGVEPFLHSVLGKGEFQLQYQNRLREILDLLFNPDQMYPFLAELASRIDTPANGNSMVDADRYKWDYNPIFDTRYVSEARTEPGHYYIESPDGTFRGMVELMRLWVYDRAKWAETYLLTDHNQPATPAIAYEGAAGFPADQLRFATSPYADPQGVSTFGGMEWRIAEVTHPGAVNYDPNGPRLFEIDAAWESGVLFTYGREMTPPPGVIQPGHAYRVRVRMQDETGRWSHWSRPVEFVATWAAADINWNLKITEIMYHPLPFENIPDADLEYIELFNSGSAPYPLSGVRIVNGIDYEFPAGSQLGPGEFLVLAGNAEAFKRRHGFTPFGQFRRNLSNAGDTVTLLDPWGRIVSNTEYTDEPPWPVEADGSGYAMVYDWTRGGSNNPRAWLRGNVLGGSPGADDPQIVLVSEVLVEPAALRAVELYNPGNRAANVGHWFLSDRGSDPRKVWLPAGSTVPAGGYLVISGDRLNQSGFDGAIDWSTGQGQMVLSSANERGQLTGYQTTIRYGVTEAGVSSGRFVDSLGREHFPAQVQVTLGAANAGPRFGPLVISAVNYHPSSGSEYIELTNISGATVPLHDPARPAQTWQLQGGDFIFPAGIEVPPGGQVLVAPGDPAEACAAYGNRGFTRIVGAYTSLLNDKGQRIALVRPVDVPAGTAYAVVDSVTYDTASPWPPAAAGLGASMRRANVGGFGDDPANWRGDSALPGRETAPSALPSLCSFTARAAASGSNMEIAWRLVDDASVTGYRLWRGPDMDRNHAQEVPLPDHISAGAATGQTIVVLDTGAAAGTLHYYWLDAIVSGGEVRPLGSTSTQMDYRYVFLPVLKQ